MTPDTLAAAPVLMPLWSFGLTCSSLFLRAAYNRTGYARRQRQWDALRRLGFVAVD